MANIQEDACAAGVPRHLSTRILGVGIGWCHVAFGMLINIIIVGTTFYSYGLFVRPVSAELGLGRAAVNVGLVAMRVGGAVASPAIGHIIDRYPAKWILRVSALMVGLAFIVIGTTSSAWVMLICLALPIALGVVGASLVIPVIAARWFTEMRGRAIALAALGTSLSGVTTLPLMAYLVGTLDWRHALIVSGVGICIALWLISMFVSEPDGLMVRKGGEPHKAANTDTPRLRAKELAKIPDFWLLTFSFSLLLGVDTATLATLIPYVQDLGFSLVQATSVVTLKTVSALCGKLIVAWIADKVDLRKLFAVIGFLGSILCVVLIFDPSYYTLMAVGSVTGIAIGGTMPVGNAMMAARFGVPSLGLVNGMIFPFASAVGGGCLLLIGAAYDWNGNYHLAFEIFAVMNVIGIGALYFMRPLKSPGIPRAP